MTKNNARRATFLKIKATVESTGQEWEPHGERVHQFSRKYGMMREKSAHKIGANGDRVGWGKSAQLEAGGKDRKWTPEDRAWRECVLHRDGYKCVICESTEQLEADHIKPVYLYPELRFNLENGQTLCHSCHTQTETYGLKVKRIQSVSVE